MAIHRTADTAKPMKAAVIKLTVGKPLLHNETPYSFFSPVNDRIDYILLLRYAMLHFSSVFRVVVVEEFLHVRGRGER